MLNYFVLFCFSVLISSTSSLALDVVTLINILVYFISFFLPGNHTKISLKTRNVFIDITALDLAKV